MKESRQSIAEHCWGRREGKKHCSACSSRFLKFYFQASLAALVRRSLVFRDFPEKLFTSSIELLKSGNTRVTTQVL
jgi:hypothetical protein